ncbi:nuclear protein MDM1-like isoform X2 [Mytilus californianus]|uniref:nuclear protein MDM1-like isoform X2 n=1 Tax=Mytilus californianus TaxID=6549 RepID=UPI00224830C2|nr:nuclear protein MDM1-like isoform X2 [Mytilus californianus]
MRMKKFGTSEYDTEYKWLDSFKSNRFVPTPEQDAPVAGLSSAELGFESVPFEPPIQRKKRTTGPSTSLSTNFYESPGRFSDDYQLLGANDKFVTNVKYRSKSHGRAPSPPKQQKLSKKTKEENKENLRKTAPAPYVNIDRFREPPNAPRREKYTEPVKRQERVNDEPSTPLTPRKPKEYHGLRKEDFKSKTVDVNREVAFSKQLKDKNVNNMNEFAQTDLQRGIMDSAPEAPAEYALKYKAGIAPYRPRKKTSEYAKAFDWKERIPSSPMLAAEQVVYNSNPAMSPSKRDVVAKSSEYNAQYKGWKTVPSLTELKKEELKEAETNQRQSRSKGRQKKKIPRSKSASASPDRLPPAGTEKLVTSDDKRMLRGFGEIKKEVPKVPKGPVRQGKSEYASNYRSPKKFKVVHGAWKGADPPHFQPQNIDEEKTPVVSSWFAEVVELRKKAQEYKKRAQGTHFSREHLVQLMAKQADMWDLETERSSTLSALSLELGSAREQRRINNGSISSSRSSKKALQSRVLNTNNSAAATIASEDEDYKHMEDVEEEDDREPDEKLQLRGRFTEQREERARNRRLSDEYFRKPRSRPKKTAWTEQRAGERMSEGSRSSRSTETFDDDDGRIPTPVLASKESKPMRHHFDLTTPAVGGALLTSPPQVRRPMRKPRPQTAPVSKSWAQPLRGVDEDYESDDTLTEEPVYTKSTAKQKLFKTYDVSKAKLVCNPTFGKPSPDTHPLRDDEASTDRPMLTTFVDTPAKSLTVENGEVKAQKTGEVQVKRPRKPKQEGIPPTIKEGFGYTYGKGDQSKLMWTIDGGMPIPRRDPDDDVLSFSTRSVASSCSLASETYERAKRRTEEFWGKNGVASR